LVRRNLGNLTFDSLDFAFDGARGLLQDSAVFRPVLGEIGGARPQAVACRGQHGDEDQHHDHGAKRSRQTYSFQDFHGGVEKVGQQNGEQQSDHHAGA